MQVNYVAWSLGDLVGWDYSGFLATLYTDHWQVHHTLALTWYTNGDPKVEWVKSYKINANEIHFVLSGTLPCYMLATDNNEGAAAAQECQAAYR